MSTDQGESGSFPSQSIEPSSAQTAGSPRPQNTTSPRALHDTLLPNSNQNDGPRLTSPSDNGRNSVAGSTVGGSDYGDFPLTPNVGTAEAASYSTKFPAAGSTAASSRQGSYSIPRSKPTSYGANLPMSPSIMEAAIAPMPAPPPPGTSFYSGSAAGQNNGFANVPTQDRDQIQNSPRHVAAPASTSGSVAPSYTASPIVAGAPMYPAGVNPQANFAQSPAAAPNAQQVPTTVPGFMGQGQSQGQDSNAVPATSNNRTGLFKMFNSGPPPSSAPSAYGASGTEDVIATGPGPNAPASNARAGFAGMFGSGKPQNPTSPTYETPTVSQTGMAGGPPSNADDKGGRSNVQFHEKPFPSPDFGYGPPEKNKKKKMWIIIGIVIAIVVIAAAVGGGVGGKIAHDKAHANDPKPDGASCNPYAVDPCIHHCSSTEEICVSFLLVGDTCLDDYECSGALICTLGACRTKSTVSDLLPVQTNVSCTATSQCRRGETCITDNNVVVVNSGNAGYCGAQGCIYDSDCYGSEFFCVDRTTSCGLLTCLTTSDCVNYLNGRNESSYAAVATCTLDSYYQTTSAICSLNFATATLTTRTAALATPTA